MCVTYTYIILYAITRLSVQTKDTPLHMASRKGHTEVVDILIRAGANVNFVHKNVRCCIAKINDRIKT